MANTKELKNRIQSVRETKKITNAMYLIASTKMRKAKNDLDRTRPYFNALRREIKRIFRTVSDVENRYFYPADGSPLPEGTYGVLVITADKGLAGAYNMNVIKQALQLMHDHPDVRLFVVGEYGRQFFARRHIPIEQSFLYTAQNPTLERAREISACMLDMFNEGKLSKIYVIYTDMKNSLTEEAICTRLVPFHRAHFLTDEDEDLAESLDFAPSVEAVLDNVMYSYVGGFIYSALVDSFCSEQNARMNAMSAAGRNADGILTDLSVQYNQVRQAAITNEITEVSAGAKAQRQKHDREARSL
ncbi:MAG: ATP synthase F1 subunit gamma [Oscillospiraceae bacterium]|nr:ATP synthase F1 subunit gamma [Oscillospiraceae bacterium]